MLAMLLHPDRWLVTWPAALESVPATWAAILDLSEPGIDSDIAEAEAVRKDISHSQARPTYRRWTAVDVRAAAETAYIAAREAYELLCVA